MHDRCSSHGIFWTMFSVFYLHETIGSDNLFSVNLGIASKAQQKKISGCDAMHQRRFIEVIGMAQPYSESTDVLAMKLLIFYG